MVEPAAWADLPHPEIEDAGGAEAVRFRHNWPIPPAVHLAAGFDAAVGGASVLTAQQGAVLSLFDRAGRALALR